MKHHRNLLLLLVVAAAFLAGCQTAPGPYQSLDTTKYTIENTDKFILLDQPAQISVTCTGLQERILPDGRLEVVANVKNLAKKNIEVQIDCIFKDEQGIPTENETPFRKLTLTGGSTQAVQFTSLNNQARKYTIQVR